MYKDNNDNLFKVYNVYDKDFDTKVLNKFYSLMNSPLIIYNNKGD